MASSRPTPSSGRPSVLSVRVSMTIAPVRPAVAAEPTTETKAISRYSPTPSGTLNTCATKIAASAG